MIPAGVQVFVALAPVDLRCGFDRLEGLAHEHIGYDARSGALFAGRSPPGVPVALVAHPPPTEVGCWSHCRRGFWEAVVCKHPLGVEGLRRIDALFAADRALADLPPARRTLRRDALVRPHVDAFFAWVDAQRTVPRARGVESSALGYARNQAAALKPFLEKWRWIVEQTHAWLERLRRLSRCFERRAQTDEVMVQVAMIRLMLRRIAHPERETWRGTTAFAAAA